MNARDIGNKYGTQIKDYQQAEQTVLEEILIAHCNEGVRLMQNKIRKVARTKGASTLAQSVSIMPAKITPTSVEISTVSEADYWKFVDKGVRGVKRDKTMGKSPYKFKTIGASKKMIASFKKYIAATGSKGLKKQTLIRKNKKKQANLIEREASLMATYTKIGGIKPMYFAREANNQKRNKQLAAAIAIGLGQAIKVNISGSINS